MFTYNPKILGILQLFHFRHDREPASCDSSNPDLLSQQSHRLGQFRPFVMVMLMVPDQGNGTPPIRGCSSRYRTITHRTVSQQESTLIDPAWWESLVVEQPRCSQALRGLEAGFERRDPLVAFRCRALQLLAIRVVRDSHEDFAYPLIWWEWLL